MKRQYVLITVFAGLVTLIAAIAWYTEPSLASVIGTADDIADQFLEAQLLSQEKIAHWNFWIAMFTGAGLISLIWTLFDTRQMMQADAKAYVELASIQLNPHGTYGAELEFILMNHGRTPAKDFSIEGSIAVVEDGERHIDRPFAVGLRNLPGNSMRIAHGRCSEFLLNISDVLADVANSGSHGRTTLGVAIEGPDDTPNNVEIQFNICWKDIYGTRYSLSDIDSAELHSNGKPLWRGNRFRVGTSK